MICKNMLTFFYIRFQRDRCIYSINFIVQINNNPSCKEKAFKPNEITIYPCDVIDLIPIIYD